MRFSSNGNHRTDWGLHAAAEQRVTYVRTRQETRAMLRAAAIVWLVFAAGLLWLLTSDSEAMETCQRTQSFDTCASALR